MKKYAITSSAFTGEVLLTFYDTSDLQSFTFEGCNCSAVQQKWLLEHLPKNEADLFRLQHVATNLTITELPSDITFDDFWNRYDDKYNSSKKRTLAKWNKMSDTDRCRAFRYISTYFRNLPQNTRKKYAETYLNAELWNNFLTVKDKKI
jgi:hypothetical protein